MALVKRPGSPESRIEWDGSTPAAEPHHLIDLFTPGAATMARKKASKTGTYNINGGFYRYVEGDEFPEGVDATLIEAEGVATGDSDDEERAIGPAPENRAHGKAPENR